MLSRSNLSFEMLLAELSHHPEYHDVTQTVIGFGKNKQTVTIVDNQIMVQGDPQHAILPLTLKEKLEQLLAKLKIPKNSSIDTQSEVDDKPTALLAAIKLRDEHLIKVLLDHGANPCIGDIHDNDAFILAIKCGFDAILEELCSLIEDENQSNSLSSSKTENQNQTPLADSKQSNETNQTTEQKNSSNEQVPLSKNDKTTLRRRLDHQVLEHTNKAGESATQLVQQTLDKLRKNKGSVKKEKVTEKGKEKENEKTNPKPTPFKQLVKELTQFTKKDIEEPIVDPKVEAAKAKELEKQDLKTASDLNDRYIENHNTAIRNLFSRYDHFLKNKMTFFAATPHINKDDDINAAIERERKRPPITDDPPSEYPQSPKECSPHPKLPAFHSDQDITRAAICLLKEYYAPESAPLPHFLECGALRRFLTFHWGRRYSNEAEKLFGKLQIQPLNTAQDILRIYDYVSRELAAISLLPHDSKNLNNMDNSSYVRRLGCILNNLESTHAVRFRNDGDENLYLERIDLLQYQTHTLLVR